MCYSRSTNCWLRYIYLNSAYHDGNYSCGINSSLNGGLPLIVRRWFLYSLVSPSHVILIVRQQLMILINLLTLRNGHLLIVRQQFLHSLVSVLHQLSRRFKGHLYHQKPETHPIIYHLQWLMHISDELVSCWPPLPTRHQFLTEVTQWSPWSMILVKSFSELIRRRRLLAQLHW